ncbi:MAG: YaiI/YqxD family protein [Thiohalospira sp.]|uniref:YaiI/YqxD family protein n=1 Tax=Thiohalorhabdus sp. TaxID=3094134 RepID=UPI00397F3D86
MTIWIDADGCPNDIRQIVLRASKRTETPVVLVANRELPEPKAPQASTVRVGAGADVADNYIAQHMARGDLVVTADLPLAAEVVENGGTALSPRGETFTAESVRQKLSMRDFMEQMRGAGLAGGGPAPQSNRDRQAFANALDRWLAQQGPD